MALAPRISCDAAGLRDLADGIVYPLNAPGRDVACSLGTPRSICALADDLGRRFAIPADAAGADIREFVQELHGQRLVSVRQSFWLEAGARLRAGARNLWSRARRRGAVRLTYPTRRHPATSARILWACCEAHQPTALIGLTILLALELPLWLAAALRGVPTLDAVAAVAMTAGLLMGTYLAAMVASAAVHELAHYWTAHWLGLRPRTVGVRMFAVGITHDAGRPPGSLLVSVSGPALAAAALVSLALLVATSPLGAPSARVLASLVLLIVAAQHCVALTPLAADGRRIAAGAIALLRSWAGR